MATFHVSKNPIDQIEADLLVLAVPRGAGPLLGATGMADWRLGGKLSALVREGKCSGEQGEQVLVLNAPKLASASAVLAGVGALDGVGANEAADRLLGTLVAASKAGAKNAAVAADYLVGEGRPFASTSALLRVLSERARDRFKDLPGDVTLTTLDLDLF